MGGFPGFWSFLIKPGAVDDISWPKTIPKGAMGSKTVSDGEFLNPPPDSVPTLNPVEGGVSEENSVAFSSFGLSGCSFRVRLCVREVEEATGGVCVKKTVRFCERSFVKACVVLIFVFFAFFSIPEGSGH